MPEACAGQRVVLAADRPADNRAQLNFGRIQFTESEHFTRINGMKPIENNEFERVSE